MENAKRKSDRVGLIVMIVLAAVLLPVLVINVTLIIKGSVNKDVPPDIFGIAPLAVTSGSMEGENDDSFGRGALIFVRILDADGKNDLSVGDIVTFRFEHRRALRRQCGRVGELFHVSANARRNSRVCGYSRFAVHRLRYYPHYGVQPQGESGRKSVGCRKFGGRKSERIGGRPRRVESQRRGTCAPSGIGGGKGKFKEEGGAASAEETEAAHEDDSKNTDGAEGR